MGFLDEMFKIARDIAINQDPAPRRPRLPIKSPLENLAESFIDNVIRSTVDNPAIGSVVYCELAAGLAEHSGIYIGNGKIVHLDGEGVIEAVSVKKFMKRLGGINTAISIYVSCKGNKAVGAKAVAKRAKEMIGTSREYNLVLDNCHQFTAGCLTGDFENHCNFLFLLKDEAGERIGADTWRVWRT